MWRDTISEPNAHFQPAADSTTFFQILDADGGTPIFNVNTVTNYWNVKPVTIGTGGTGTNNGASLIVAGDIQIAGNDIQDASGNAVIRFNGNGALSSLPMLSFNLHMDWDKVIRFGRNSEFGLGMDDGTDTLQVIRGQVVGTNVLAAWTAGGNLGLGSELAAETLLELTHATPYQTFHNSTHEDSDSGRESRLNFKGEQSGGEETTLARIEVSHDGAADDQKGKIGIYTNDGSDDDTPTLRMTIDSAGATDVVGDLTAGTIQADNGVSGTLELDDGSTEKITLVFTGGILTSRTVAATTGSVLADWTD